MDENTSEWADQHFVVKNDERLGLIGHPGGAVRYCSAEADTGYRYSVCVTELPPAGKGREGGPVLLTVTSPWVDAHALQTTGYLSERYVAEHLCGAPYRKVGDGDLRAITLLVRYALDRESTERNYRG